MIRYALKCPDGHAFDSWFQSAEAFDRLQGAGMVACAVCGATGVQKALMAPAVATPPAPPATGIPDRPAAGPLSAPQSPAEAALAALRRHVEENSEYVGLRFSAEARAIHEGSAPDRAIHGEARPDEARRLIEDGVPVAPLPFLPARKAN